MKKCFWKKSKFATKWRWKVRI